MDSQRKMTGSSDFADKWANLLEEEGPWELCSNELVALDALIGRHQRLLDCAKECGFRRLAAAFGRDLEEIQNWRQAISEAVVVHTTPPQE
jgi:hypothetical protein